MKISRGPGRAEGAGDQSEILVKRSDKSGLGSRRRSCGSNAAIASGVFSKAWIVGQKRLPDSEATGAFSGDLSRGRKLKSDRVVEEARPLANAR